MASKIIRVITCDQRDCPSLWQIPPEYGTNADVTPPGWWSLRQRPESNAECGCQATLCSLACTLQWARGSHEPQERDKTDWYQASLSSSSLFAPGVRDEHLAQLRTE